MDYTTKLGERPTQAHVNYQCPCGCVAGLLYDRELGSEHLGRCCCGRLLWVGPDARDVLAASFDPNRDYGIEEDLIAMPWGESVKSALGVPADAAAREKAKLDAGRTLTKVIDPVCKMMIDPDDAAGHANYQARTYYFCAVSCLTEFRRAPAEYVPHRSLLSRLLRR